MAAEDQDIELTALLDMVQARWVEPILAHLSGIRASLDALNVKLDALLEDEEDEHASGVPMVDMGGRPIL